MPIKQGEVLWARCVDPQGANEKSRPVLVLTLSEQIAQGDPIVAAAITTTFPRPLTDEYVELPWDERHRHIGLKKRFAVLCSWLGGVLQAGPNSRRGSCPTGRMDVADCNNVPEVVHADAIRQPFWPQRPSTPLEASVPPLPIVRNASTGFLDRRHGIAWIPALRTVQPIQTPSTKTTTISVRRLRRRWLFDGRRIDSSYTLSPPKNWPLSARRFLPRSPS